MEEMGSKYADVVCGLFPLPALVCRVGDAWTVEIQNRHACKMEKRERRGKKGKEKEIFSTHAYLPTSLGMRICS